MDAKNKQTYLTVLGGVGDGSHEHIKTAMWKSGPVTLLSFDSGTFSPQSIAKMFADIGASSVLVNGLSKLNADNLTAITTGLPKVAESGFSAALSLRKGLDQIEDLYLGNALILASSQNVASPLDGQFLPNLSSALASRRSHVNVASLATKPKLNS